MRNAGLFRKTPEQSGERPNSPVSLGHHAQLRSTHSVHAVSSIGRCSPTLLSRAPQTETSAACHPLSLRRKRHHCWLFYSGLKESQSLGVGPQGIKTLFHHILPYRFWSSPRWSTKVGVGAERQSWPTTEGVAQGSKQLQMLFINEDFSRVW